jgi:hypothetical protein
VTTVRGVEMAVAPAYSPQAGDDRPRAAKDADCLASTCARARHDDIRRAGGQLHSEGKGGVAIERWDGCRHLREHIRTSGVGA